MPLVLNSSSITGLSPVGGLSSPQTGSVLQVVSTTITAVSSTTSTTFANISGFSAIITPVSSSSRIFIVLSVAGCSDGGGGLIKVQRNGVDIMIGTGGTSNRTNVTMQPFYNHGDNNVATILTQNFLDSPSSTSALTYQIQFRKGASGTFTINRNISNVDEPYTSYVPSTVTLFEIAG